MLNSLACSGRLGAATTGPPLQHADGEHPLQNSLKDALAMTPVDAAACPQFDYQGRDSPLKSAWATVPAIQLC